jgi:hypothetical protein
MAGFKWLPEQRIPVASKLAALRHRAGDKEEARKEADAELAKYNTEREQIVDIYRAGALRPLAEAYVTMGAQTEARAVYMRALEEGVHNPNSRPRAMDLASTCCSMALRGFEPDDALWARMEQIKKQLGDPW